MCFLVFLRCIQAGARLPELGRMNGRSYLSAIKAIRKRLAIEDGIKVT
jgi:hypothetical protein